MSNSISKEVYVENPNTTTELDFGAVDVEFRGENDMGSFQRPRPGGSAPLTKALNLNQYKRTITVNGVFGDDYASKEGGRGTVTISDKENLRDQLISMFHSTDLLTFHWGGSTYDGYMQSYRFKERGKDENSVLEFQGTFLVSVPMRQGN